MPLAPSLDTVGPLARTAADCALLLQITAGSDANDPNTSNRIVPAYFDETRGDLIDTSMAVPLDLIQAHTHPEVAASIKAAIEVFSRSGIEVDEAPVLDIETCNGYANLIFLAEASSLHQGWMHSRPDDYSESVRTRLEAGFAIPAASYIAALRQRGPALRHFCDTLEQSCLLLPVIPSRTPEAEGAEASNSAAFEAFLRKISMFTRWVNYLGLPSIALPCGIDSRGMPLGMQIVGRPFSEAVLFRIAHAYQCVTDWHRGMPMLPAAGLPSP
jgi:aspartyl-tRNA(Asn)/glutamyl-tRNA(Gln) amidotransferase subunit A